MRVKKFKNELKKVSKFDEMFCISDNDDFRYILGSINSSPVVVMGINPSTANSAKKDNTTKRVESIIENNNYDSYTMFNVCAARKTNLKDFNPKEPNLDKLHKENLIAFKWLLENIKEKGKKPVVWAAWGCSLTDYTLLKKMFVRYLKDIVKVAKQYDVEWKLVNTTTSGHPRHPLSLKKKSSFIAFDIDEYINKLKG